MWYKKILTSIFVFLLLCLFIGHDIGMAYAEKIQVLSSCTHCSCEPSEEKKQNHECCFISKDASIHSSFIEKSSPKKVLKKKLDLSLGFIAFQESIQSSLPLSPLNQYTKISDPPPNFYTTLVGIIKQVK